MFNPISLCYEIKIYHYHYQYHIYMWSWKVSSDVVLAWEVLSVMCCVCRVMSWAYCVASGVL